MVLHGFDPVELLACVQIYSTYEIEHFTYWYIYYNIS